MNKSIKVAVSILASIGLATGVSVSSANAAPAKITVANVYGNTFDPFWTSFGCGAKAEAKRLGVTYKEFTQTGNDAASYTSQFNSALLTKPNGLLVNVANANQFVTQQKAQLAKAVPVATINGSSPASQFRIVGSETNDLSATIAALTPSGAGKVGIVNGIAGLVPVDNRLNPVINAVLNANSSLVKLEPAYTFFDSAKATSAASAMIVANPDLKVLIAGTGPDGAGVAAAVKAAGLSGKITVIALDATPQEVTYLKEGTITALVAQSPKLIGAAQVKTVVDQIKANKSKKAIAASTTKIGIPQRVLTKANVGNKSNADWIYSATCK